MKPEHVPLAVAAGMLLAGCVLLVIVVTRHRRRLRRLAAGGRGRHPEGEPAGRSGAAGELDQVARRLESRMDAKIAEIQRLLADADERIAQLRRLTASEAASSDSGAPPQADPARRREEILRLHSQGMDAVRIARRMEMDVGEVHLVLNLHRQQTRSSPPAES